MKKSQRNRILAKLTKKYGVKEENKDNDNNLQNNTIEQEKYRLGLENQVNNLDFKTPFGELDREEFNKQFNLKDSTSDYLNKKIEFHQLLKLHKFINNAENSKYLEGQDNLKKVFEEYKNSKDATKFIRENKDAIENSYNTALVLKPVIDVNNHFSSLDGIDSRYSHKIEGDIKPQQDGYIRVAYDPSRDNKTTSPKGYSYWVDDKTIVNVNGAKA